MSSQPFVAQLRSRPGTITLVGAGQAGITVRVQMLEVWDTVRIVASPSEPVLTVKVRALEALYPEGEYHDDFVVKLDGFEVLDENASLEAAGAVDGSTFLIGFRRRRPIRNS